MKWSSSNFGVPFIPSSRYFSQMWGYVQKDPHLARNQWWCVQTISHSTKFEWGCVQLISHSTRIPGVVCKNGLPLNEDWMGLYAPTQLLVPYSFEWGTLGSGWSEIGKSQQSSPKCLGFRLLRGLSHDWFYLGNSQERRLGTKRTKFRFLVILQWC